MGWELKKYPMYYGGVKQTYPNLEPGRSFLSRSAVVGNIIFLSSFDARTIKTGDVASNKFEEQTIACLDNIRLTLEEAGSSMDNLVKNFVLLKDVKDCPSMWKTMLDYYQKHAPQLVEEPPVITITQVEALATPDCLIEIDSIGVVSKDEPGWEVKKYPMYYGGVKQVYPNVEPGMPFLSESVAIGNLLFLSGMTAENPDTGRIETKDLENQMNMLLDKVGVAMDRPGSSMSNIIKTVHFLTGVKGLTEASAYVNPGFSPASDRMWRAELWYYDSHAPYLLDEGPATTFMKVSSLANPEASVQDDVIGVISRYRAGWKVKKYPCYLRNRGFPRHIGDDQKYYSNSVVVGNLVFLSGQVPVDRTTGKSENEDFERAACVTLDNVRRVLEQSGTSLENVVKTHIFIPNHKYHSLMRKVELEYYQKYAPSLVDEPPASCVIHLFNLALPDQFIEIEAIALVPDS